MSTQGTVVSGEQAPSNGDERVRIDPGTLGGREFVLWILIYIASWSKMASQYS